jgi:hypothetical protein
VDSPRGSDAQVLGPEARQSGCPGHVEDQDDGQRGFRDGTETDSWYCAITAFEADRQRLFDCRQAFSPPRRSITLEGDQRIAPCLLAADARFGETS